MGVTGCRLICKYIACVIAVVALSGCGGTSVLKEPHPQPQLAALSSVSNSTLAVDLDWVVVRNGPGSWAANADWDEYLLRVTNRSDQPLEITRLTVVDSLGERIEPRSDRRVLVKGSKQAVKRYKEADLEVHAGMSGAGLLATGTAMAVAGGYVGLSAAFGSLAGTAAAPVLGSAAVVAVYAAPVLMVGGAVRGVNNFKVDSEIHRRQSVLPIVVSANEQKPISVFYPISPSPGAIEIAYRDELGEHELLLDTHEALKGLHLELPNSNGHTGQPQLGQR